MRFSLFTMPHNAAKSVEERNIPWSQQVDEASYENLSSPTHDEVSGEFFDYKKYMGFQKPSNPCLFLTLHPAPTAYTHPGNDNSMQFQYPPFNFKENCNTPWNNMNKGRKANANHGMYSSYFFFFHPALDLHSARNRSH